jgi:hypothetical protein
MLKKFAAIGLGAALVLSPLAALGQTDQTTAPATGAAPAAGTDTGAMAPKPMKHHKKHMAKKKPMAAPAAEPAAPAEAPKS